jgi:hypothetical protein
MVRLIRYGRRFIPATARDKDQIQAVAGYIEAEIFTVVPGSSIKKRFITNRSQLEYKSRVLSAAIRSVLSGEDIGVVMERHGREFGPGLRKAVTDYVYARRATETDTCYTFHEQTPDGCGGCTFGGDTGGPEFGYGAPRNRCMLTPVFLDVPDDGFGRGDAPSIDHDTPPGKTKQRTKTPRLTEAGEKSPKEHFPGDTIVNNDQGYWEPFGDEQGLKDLNRLFDDRGPVLGVPIDPLRNTNERGHPSDPADDKEGLPAEFRPK